MALYQIFRKIGKKKSIIRWNLTKEEALEFCRSDASTHQDIIKGQAHAKDEKPHWQPIEKPA